MAETQMTAQIGLLTIYRDCWDATYGRFTRRKNRHKNCHQSDPGDYLITQSVSPNIKFAKIQYLINPDTQKLNESFNTVYTCSTEPRYGDCYISCKQSTKSPPT